MSSRQARRISAGTGGSITVRQNQVYDNRLGNDQLMPIESYEAKSDSVCATVAGGTIALKERPV